MIARTDGCFFHLLVLLTITRIVAMCVPQNSHILSTRQFTGLKDGAAIPLLERCLWRHGYAIFHNLHVPAEEGELVDVSGLHLSGSP